MSQTKKELKDAYRSRTVVGGVYRICCAATGEQWLRPSTDLRGSQNRFAFSIATQSCPEPCVAQALRQHGAQSLSFEVVEELKKGELQTDREFAGDVDALLALWIEKGQEGGPLHGTKD